MKNKNYKPTAKNGLLHTTAILQTVLELHSNAHNPRGTQADSIGAWRQIIPEWWTGWMGPLVIVQPNPSAQTGPPRVNCPGPCPNSFGIPLRWTLHFSTRTSVWSPSQEQSASWCWEGTPCASECAHGKEHGSLFFIPFRYLHTCIDPLSLLQAEQPQLS